MTIKTLAKTLSKTLTYTVAIPFALFTQSAMGFDFNLDKEQRTVAPFTQLEVSGLAEVYLSQGTVGDVEVKASGISMKDIVTRTENGKLTVTTKGFHSGETVKVYVSYDILNVISVGGAAELYGQDTVTADTLTININDAGDAELTVDVGTLKVEMKGAGNLKIDGKAAKQQLRSYNSHGSLDNSNLSYGR
ncbi:MAG: DUF2807 domain-containing protein [Psychrosphaera sp.]|nr:DUF2807 domain-containing protein [Psychrosphaera sp.]